MYTDEGSSLLEMSVQKPVLLVFLRNFGCIFCREALVHIAENAEDWRAKDIDIVLVHLSDPNTAKKYFSEYGIKNLESVSDPYATWYARFGLLKGKVSQLIGLQTLIRGYEIARSKKIYLRRAVGDGLQMPGMFLLRHGEIADSFIHKKVADVPDYDRLIHCCQELPPPIHNT